jgi:homoserine dehydrogenase
LFKPLGVTLVGCGTVGAAVADLLLARPQRWQLRAGRPIELRHVVVREAAKPRRSPIPADLLTTDFERAIGDAAAEVVVEVIGGTGAARDVVLMALGAGKHVVTANKALLAERGDELFAAARVRDRVLAFEAAVAGGVPVISTIAQGLAANRITAVRGILNGTSNFILTAMADHGSGFAEALADAQARGFAETDPSLDLQGTDAAHKLAVLARVAFRRSVPPAMIATTGITGVKAEEVARAAAERHTIKLVAEARLGEDGQLALKVAPTWLPHDTPLARVGGADNAVLITGDVVGALFLQGPGAGPGPTASAVVADLIDLAVGRAQAMFAASRGWDVEPPGV